MSDIEVKGQDDLRKNEADVKLPWQIGSLKPRTVKAIVIVTVSAALIGYAILVSLLAMYGFQNPDPEQCFYVNGLDTTSTTRLAAEALAKEKSIAVMHGYPVDMGRLFRSWFIWGFECNMIALTLHLIFVPMFFLSRGTFNTTRVIYLMIQVVNSF